MKRQIYTIIAMMVLVASMAVAAKAQNPRPMQLTASIPFQFNIGNETLPAGEYRLLSVSNDSPTVILSLLTIDGKSKAMFQTSSVEGKRSNHAKLVFRRYGNKYFFSQAWLGGEGIGLEASKSRTERAAEREFARIQMASELVDVVARR